MTIPDLARSTGRAASTLRAACRRLGIAKHGRDYVLTDATAKCVLAEARTIRGRPPRPMTPEQIAARREYQREYQRRRRSEQNGTA